MLRRLVATVASQGLRAVRSASLSSSTRNGGLAGAGRRLINAARQPVAAGRPALAAATSRSRSTVALASDLPSGEEMAAAVSLCELAAAGDVAGLKAVLGRSGVDVNSRDYDLRTGLHLAAANGMSDAVELLLKHGARSSFDRFGALPQHEAKRFKHYHVEKLLARSQQDTPEVLSAAATALGIPKERHDQLHLVFRLILNEGIFSYALVTSEVRVCGRAIVRVCVRVAGRRGVRWLKTLLPDALWLTVLCETLLPPHATPPPSPPPSCCPPLLPPFPSSCRLLSCWVLSGWLGGRPAGWLVLTYHGPAALQVLKFYSRLEWDSYYYELFTPPQIAKHVLALISSQHSAISGEVGDNIHVNIHDHNSLYTCFTDGNRRWVGGDGCWAVWFGLVLVWLGLAWFGLVWFGWWVGECVGARRGRGCGALELE
jgi:hypothetical protein